MFCYLASSDSSSVYDYIILSTGTIHGRACRLDINRSTHQSALRLESEKRGNIKVVYPGFISLSTACESQVTSGIGEKTKTSRLLSQSVCGRAGNPKPDSRSSLARFLG